MKRTIPLMIVLILGIVYFFIPFITSPFSIYFMQKEVFENWLKIMGVFAVVMSITSLLRRNFYKIRRKAPGYKFSFVELGGLFVMFTFAILLPQVYIGKDLLLGGIRDNSVYYWIFSNIQVPMQATMFSMLAFYISSAAYRSFRARNTEATLLLVTAGIVMIGRVPLGEDIYQLMLGIQQRISPNFNWALIFNFQGITDWILDIPNTATKRAMGFGISMGMLATSLKIMFGIEKSWLGGTE